MKFLKNNRGITIMEAMIGISIAGIGMAGFMNMNTSMNKNLKNMESKMEEMMFLTQVMQSLNNPTTCTKTFGDYCEGHEGEVINPTACKGSGMTWVENEYDLNLKVIPVKKAFAEYTKKFSPNLSNISPTISKTAVLDASNLTKGMNLNNTTDPVKKSFIGGYDKFAYSVIPRLFNVQNSASIDRLWLSRTRSFANTCKSMEGASGSASNFKTLNRFKNLFSMGAKFIFGSFASNVKAIGIAGMKGAPNLPAASNGSSNKTFSVELPRTTSPTGITPTTGNTPTTGITPITNFLNPALTGSFTNLIGKDLTGITRVVQPTIPDYQINMGAITAALGSGVLAEFLAAQKKGEECSSNWSNNIILEDIRLSMDAGDPLPNLREHITEVDPSFPIDIPKVSQIQPSQIMQPQLAMLSSPFQDFGSALDGMQLIPGITMATAEFPNPLYICKNPYSPLHNQRPGLSLHKVYRAFTSDANTAENCEDGKCIEFNKIRPKNLTVLIKYYMPNLMGGIHRDRTFTINAFPLMLDDQSDTSTVRVGKCGIFTDTYESSVFDGCSNVELNLSILPSLVFNPTQNPMDLVAVDPKIVQATLNYQPLRELFPPSIQREINTGIPTVPVIGDPIQIDPTVINTNPINSGQPMSTQPMEQFQNF